MKEDFSIKTTSPKATPFLKWVGGKRSIIEELKKRLPGKFSDYYEAFVGGGALFFEIYPQLKKGAFLSDANGDLVTTYNVIKTNPEGLVIRLQQHQLNHNKDYFYAVRSIHSHEDEIEKAARMIYLNKTCFNGLWRVNKKGEFNVPIGSYKNPAIVQEENIMACSNALQSTTITRQDYQDIKPAKGSFVYFDPPYHPLNDTSFTAYAKLDFSEEDQANLAEFCKGLHKKGVHIMLSNSNTPFIRDLFSNPIFNVQVIKAPRFVNSNAAGRGAVEEVLITNY